ncbi:MAG: hypothetical protein DRP11_03545 [Candidatus Aenigmatarchaeota archaeon]|nr:MAG: hypothetical protein DRP11_03545 [Candidatus Aenigmarchaeota archaeon]
MLSSLLFWILTTSGLSSAPTMEDVALIQGIMFAQFNAYVPEASYKAVKVGGNPSNPDDLFYLNVFVSLAQDYPYDWINKNLDDPNIFVLYTNPVQGRVPVTPCFSSSYLWLYRELNATTDNYIGIFTRHYYSLDWGYFRAGYLNNYMDVQNRSVTKSDCSITNSTVSTYNFSLQLVSEGNYVYRLDKYYSFPPVSGFYFFSKTPYYQVYNYETSYSNIAGFSFTLIDSVSDTTSVDTVYSDTTGHDTTSIDSSSGVVIDTSYIPQDTTLPYLDSIKTYVSTFVDSFLVLTIGNYHLLFDKMRNLPALAFELYLPYAGNFELSVPSELVDLILIARDILTVFLMVVAVLFAIKLIL